MLTVECYSMPPPPKRIKMTPKIKIFASKLTVSQRLPCVGLRKDLKPKN